jgi:hypothetical protein
MGGDAVTFGVAVTFGSVELPSITAVTAVTQPSIFNKVFILLSK